VESQAIKRVHRIGQTRKITVTTLAIRGTAEEKMVSRRDLFKNSRDKIPKLIEEAGMRHFIANPKFIETEPELLKSVDEPLFKIKPLQGIHDSLQKPESVSVTVDDSPKAAKRLRFGDSAADDLASADQEMTDDITPSPKSNPPQASTSVLRRSSKIGVRVEGRIDSEPKSSQKKKMKKKSEVNFA